MLSKLKHVKAIAITSDGWSCNNLKAFYANCTTCHFIDDNWRLNSFVLDVSELEGRHTAINIQTHWKNKLSEWNISSESTELSIVVDGAADYAKAAREFAKSSFWCRSEEHTSELQSQSNLVCRLLLAKKSFTAARRIAITCSARASVAPA